MILASGLMAVVRAATGRAEVVVGRTDLREKSHGTHSFGQFVPDPCHGATPTTAFKAKVWLIITFPAHVA
jgi:hypothetical protein